MVLEIMRDVIINESVIVGEEKLVDDIIEEVLKDIDFYEEFGGGIMLFGGEIFV